MRENVLEPRLDLPWRAHFSHGSRIHLGVRALRKLEQILRLCFLARLGPIPLEMFSRYYAIAHRKTKARI